jgi:HPt (histidine-containing phosphotransfer) domain-containing protein
MAKDSAEWRTKEVFDRALYDRLDEETGGAGLEIVATILSVANARKLAMLEAAASDNRNDLSRVAHTAKSGSRSVGLLRLSALCDMIEHLQPAAPGDLAALCPDIEREFDESIAILQKLQQE